MVVEDFGCEIEAPADTIAAIKGLGRTEDIRLSPDNKCLAIADFVAGRILLMFLTIDRGGAKPRIIISDHMYLLAEELNLPHGISFLDNDHMLVANRMGNVVLFKLPRVKTSKKVHTVRPLSILKANRSTKIRSPGSIECYPLTNHHHRLIVCNNFAHRVTSHELSFGKVNQISNGTVLIDQKLRIPDGVSISPDHAYIAVSNHATGSVLVYRNDHSLNARSKPVKVLGPSSLICPHGLRFSADGKFLLVADAVTPYLHIFKCNTRQWDDASISSSCHRILDEEIYLAGRINALEGGVKGIEIDSEQSIIFTTCEEQSFHVTDFMRLFEEECFPDPIESERTRTGRDRALRRSWYAKKFRFWR